MLASAGAEALLRQLASKLDGLPSSPRWWLAFSGGLDSTVLLHLLSRLRPAGVELCALHVHHGLSHHADAWEAHTRRCCEQWGVRWQAERVAVARKHRESLEDCARRARYSAIDSVLGQGELVFSAHHQTDQIETLLLRLNRGAGPAALAGMPWLRPQGAGWLCRPLLDVPRATLEAYAQAHQLSWVEDESNQSERFDRNYLRHRILPPLRERWPGFADSWCQSQQWLRESAELNDILAEQDLAALDARPERWGHSLSAQLPAGWSEARRRNLLRHWIARIGLPVPPRDRMARILLEVLPARADATPLVAWPGGELRRYGGRLHAMAPLPAFDPTLQLQWDGSAPLHLPGVGVLSMSPPGALGACEVSLRQGGERFKPYGRGHSQSLKKLLQETDTPPWWRDRWPLLYRDGALIAVPGLGPAAELGQATLETLTWQPGA